MKIVSKWLVLLLLTIAAPSMALAGPPKAVVLSGKLEDAIFPGATTTYLDLARRFVADLKWDGSHYSGKDYRLVRHAGGPGNDKTDFDPAAIDRVRRIDFAAGGRPQMVLLFDFAEGGETTQGFAVLAFYDLSQGVRFLDAVDVGLDRWTSFRDPPVLTLSTGEPVLLVASTHFNSSQSYMFTSLVLARKEQLIPVTTYFTLGSQGCAGRVEQNSSFRALPAKAKGAPDTIEVTVDVKAEESGEECNGEKLPTASRKIVVRFDWNRKSGQYKPSSDSLQRLEEENMKDL